MQTLLLHAHLNFSHNANFYALKNLKTIKINVQTWMYLWLTDGRSYIEGKERSNNSRTDGQRRFASDSADADVRSADASNKRRSSVQVDAQHGRRFDWNSFVENTRSNKKSVLRVVASCSDRNDTGLKRNDRDVDQLEWVRLNDHLDSTKWQILKLKTMIHLFSLLLWKFQHRKEFLYRLFVQSIYWN